MWCNPEGEEHLFTFADMKRWSDKTANYLAAHGVGKGEAEVDIKVVLRSDGALVLRIRDNGRAFNPLDYDLEAGDNFGCIGSKLVRSLIADLEYQNVLGLNNTVVTLKP